MNTEQPSRNQKEFTAETSLGAQRGIALLYRDLVARLRAVPGVDSAAFAVVRILSGDEWDSTISVEGYEAKPGEEMNPFFNAISPGYFETIGLSVMAGRDFLPSDLASKHKVGIVNEKFAKKYFGDGTAVGRHFGFGGDPGTKTDIEIVGMVKDAKYMNMRDTIPLQDFVPYDQMDMMTSVTFYTRTRLDPEPMYAALRHTVREMDSNMPLYAMRTLDVQLDQSLSTERLIAFLAAVFAASAASSTFWSKTSQSFSGYSGPIRPSFRV